MIGNKHQDNSKIDSIVCAINKNNELAIINESDDLEFSLKSMGAAASGHMSCYGSCTCMREF